MSLTDLFAADSPPPSPSRRPQADNPLFFSPNATPQVSQRSPRSVRSESPLSPSHSRLRRRRSTPDSDSETPPPPAIAALMNRHGAGTLHATAYGRDLSVEDDAFDVQDPLAPGPLTHDAFSSLPFPPANDPLNPLGLLDGELGEDGEPVKKRRKMAKVDYDRLLSETGLPRLMKIAKGWRVRGKGREKEDLGCLMDMYTVWAHGMFPKGDFGYTVKRVEAVSRTNRMINAIHGMKETFYKDSDGYDAAIVDPDSHPPLGPDSDLDEHDQGPLPYDIAMMQNNVLMQQPDVEGIVSSRVPLFDGPDEDELAALQDAQMQPPSIQRRQVVDMGDAPVDIGEEDDW